MIDTIIFDVDGVLWDAAPAFNRCTQYLVNQECQRLGLPDPRITLDDIHAFKRVGGFNNDWDLSWTLVVLCVARAQKRIPAEMSWPQLAAASDGRGMAWTQQYVSEAVPSFDILRDRYNAYYWGAERYHEIYDSPPVLQHRPGFAEAEKPLADPDLGNRLQAVGVRRVGVLTGRNRNEMRPLRPYLSFNGLLAPEAVFTSELGTKPDPHFLARLLHLLQARSALMVGDMIDDLRTVLAYRHLPAAQQTASIYAVQVAPVEQHAYWRDAGADATITNVNQLPDLLLREP